MANLSKTKTLFAFTSPRTIEKIIPEIRLLTDKFSGKRWDGTTQVSFFKTLMKCDFFLGEKTPADLAFAGRDRITRAPKALGFVNLSPKIELTDAGKQLLESPFTSDVITKQLLKFQLPSPYHPLPQNEFSVRPYLEFLRLVHVMGSLSKVEIALFFTQLTHFKKFNLICKKISMFRMNKKSFKGSYRAYVSACFAKEIQIIFADQIKKKDLKTRETDDSSLNKFISTKKNNLLDYADAFIRYVRATQLISFEKRTYHIIISAIKQQEVDFILNNTLREPQKFKDEMTFKSYLFASNNIPVLSDNRDLLITKIKNLKTSISLEKKSIPELKTILKDSEENLIKAITKQTAQEVKHFKNFDDIKTVFQQIVDREVPDAPLYLEWNVWRAMEMLNYALSVNGNFRIGIDGLPTDTAKGNMPDIEIEYQNFKLIVEVTTSTGATQHTMEGEPVARHLGQIRLKSKYPVFCLFIAPKVSDATIAHFFTTNRANIKHYGGQTDIIPLSLEQFLLLLETGKEKAFNDPNRLKKFFEELTTAGRTAPDESYWQKLINNSISKWLN